MIKLSQNNIWKRLIVCAVILAVHAPFTMNAGAQSSPLVYAVLFYSPSCGHCQKVLSEDLPPLIDRFGASLEILGINVATAEGQNLYRAAIEKYQIPEDRLGVPCLIIGSTVLVGSQEIPEIFPGLIESGLSTGGISIPEIPGLQEAWIAAQQSSPGVETSNSGDEQSGSSGQDSSESASSPRVIAPDSEDSVHQPNRPPAGTNLDRFKANFLRDPQGNSISVIVLIAMLGSLIALGYQLLHSSEGSQPKSPLWIIPAFALMGMLVAGYLSYVEVSKSQAVCGPVGECNLVQQSAYARLFGILPVGVLGLVGYLAILILWAIQQYGDQRWQWMASIGIGLLAFIGVVFSVYLTFLEPFIIGATCMWCITSAVLMTLILWVAYPQAKNAWSVMRSKSQPV
jgi:uncharacterized membrane protein